MKRIFGAATVALVAGAAMFVSIPCAGAVAISPTCEVFGIDGSGNPTGAALFSGVALPPINVPELGSGNVVAGTTFRCTPAARRRRCPTE